jgi:uncharacterized membrane protein
MPMWSLDQQSCGRIQRRSRHLGAFIIYQVYRYSYTHSFGLLVLTVFDAVVMVLIWQKWDAVGRHRSA